MSAWLARVVVRCSAWIAPRALRARWREEWLGEIVNAVHDLGGRFPRIRNRPPRSILRRALGAPKDALLLRRMPNAHAARRRLHLAHWRADILYTARLLARGPGYVATVVVGLGVGLTASVTVFSVLHALFTVDPPGVTDRTTLVRSDVVGFEYGARGGGRPYSIADFDIVRQYATFFDGVGASGLRRTTLRAGDRVDSIAASFVSGNYFQVLGTHPVLGRLLRPDDDRPDATVAMISARQWTTLFAGRADVIGQTMVVGDREVRVVGVLPDRFAVRFHFLGMRLGEESAVFLPLALARGWTGEPPPPGWLTLVGRLGHDVDPVLASRNNTSLRRALEAADPIGGRNATMTFQDLLLGNAARDPELFPTFLSLALAGPMLLLLIGCANTANLRLARATDRAREISVRLALGARTSDVMRLLVLESAALTMAALLVSWAGSRVLLTQLAPLVPIDLPLNWEVAAFAAVLAALTVLLSGLVPAWLVARRATAQGLKQTTHAGGLAHTKLRNTLVVAQVALSLILLTTGALFTRSLHAIYAVRPASLDDVLVAHIDLASEGYDATRAAGFLTRLLTTLRTDSRILGAGVAEYDLFSFVQVSYQIASDAAPASRQTSIQHVSPGWMEAMALDAVAGRALTAADRQDTAVVNETLAREIANGASPLGIQIRLKTGATPTEVADATVVGVVPDSVRLTNRPLRPQPMIYLPLPPEMPLRVSLLVRTHRPADLAPDLTRIIASIEPHMPWTRIETADAAFARETGPFRFFAIFATSLGVVALVLASAGLFAVMAYVVALRTREIGIRMALGARTSDVTRLVLRQVGRLTITGLVTGFVLALPLASLMRVAFVGVSPFDPLALALIAILLMTTALGAGAWPARRAAAVDPVRALRAE